ncbi:hypothetical protein Bca52824_016514 [Brassica carinata]|uniref:Uncharacterized protein n=1 Tax=Brassica carinata TaxID=52824 RepID=A0A8X7W451_BRACI|nr:hypothetical protein Bca52824_016514 [Brassica carinata]
MTLFAQGLLQPPEPQAKAPSSSPSPIALCFHHVTGSVSGSASVSSVSSSGSGEDQSQLTAPRKSNAASPKVVTRPTSPLHNRFSGMTLESSSTGRNNDGRSSEYHPLPLPPGSPTTSPSVVIMCSPTSPSSGVQGGSDSSSPLGVSKWKKGRKSNAASPKVVTRPTSPLHNRFSGMTLESSSTGRNNDGRSSEYHPLPLPPGSPTTSPSVVIMCSPTSPSSGVQGGSWVVGGSDSSSPLGVSKWKKGRFTESCTFGKVYQGLTVTRVAMCGDEFVLYSRVYQ